MSDTGQAMPSAVNPATRSTGKRFSAHGATVVSLMSCVGFSVFLGYLAIRWNAMGVFNFDNTLFDLDTSTRLQVMVVGGKSTSFIHPLFDLITRSGTLILALILQPIVWFGIVDDTVQLSALFLLPLVSGITAYVIYDLFRLLAFARSNAYGFMLIYCLSFSAIIMGSVPEHQVFNNLFLILTLRYSFYCYQSGCPFSVKYALLLGTIITGITITNIVPFSIVYFFHQLKFSGGGLVEALRRTAPIAIVCFVLAIMVPAVNTASGDSGVSGVSGDSRTQAARTTKWIQDYMAAVSPVNYVKRIGGFVIGFSDTYISSPVTLYKAKNPALRATLHEPPKSPWPYAKGLIIALAAFAGFIGWRKSGYDLKSPVGACIAIIGFYMILLIVWGTEMFLYSQFWIAPGLIVLAGVTHMLRPTVLKISLVGLVLAQLTFNLYELKNLINAFS